LDIEKPLDRHPHLLRTLIDLKLMGAGCPADLFLNLADVAKEHGLNKRAFLADPQKAIGSAGGHHHHGNGSKA